MSFPRRSQVDPLPGQSAAVFFSASGLLYDKPVMPNIDTKYFGTVPFEDEPCFEFPWGLPAFEEERCFLPLETAAYRPFLFLQSTATPSLCFVMIPVDTVDSSYQLAISRQDLAALELPLEQQPAIGSEVLVLASVSFRDNSPAAANLLAPIVINLANGRGLQAIRYDTAYSHQHPLALQAAECACGS